MLKLQTMELTKNEPFLAYLTSSSKVKKCIREFEFYSVRFYRKEGAKRFTVCFDYPYGNVFWYVDFKKSIQKDILEEDSLYAEEWEGFLNTLKNAVKAEFTAYNNRIKLIRTEDVASCMDKYNLRNYQAYDLLQLKTKMFMNDVPAGLILSEQRTGKTRVAVAAVQELTERANVVVVCPKSAIGGWEAEFEEMNAYQDRKVYDVTVFKHCREVSKYVSETTETPYLVKIISYDLFKRFTYAQLRKAIGSEYDSVVFIGDEIHRLRNFDTWQSEAIFRYKQGCLKDHRKLALIGITGTPAIKSSSDIFGVFSLINTSHIGFEPFKKDFDQFKEYFYNCEDTSYEKVCKTLKRTQELQFLVQSSSVQTKQRELELFKNYTKKAIRVALDMDGEQREIYTSVRDTFEYGTSIDCQNGLVQLTKLQQICVDASSLVSSYGVLAPKLKWIIGFAKTNPVKFLVMSKYTGPLKHLYTLLNAEGIGAKQMTGATPTSERWKLQTEFKTNPELRVLLIQLGVGREALTLPNAKCTVFLDRDFAQGFNEQAEARMTPMDGIAQTKYVIDLLMKDTVEPNIYDILVIRKENIDTVNTVSEVLKKGGG